MKLETIDEIAERFRFETRERLIANIGISIPISCGDCDKQFLSQFEHGITIGF